MTDLRPILRAAASSVPAPFLQTVETGFRLNQYEAVDCISGVQVEEEAEM